jgi:cation diffusion facilitator CzcD-associated flavoprotein CzcO
MGSIELETHYDVIVVGGGFCGVYQLKHLREQGFKTHLFEAGTALGGIWHWNAYPGARVDTAVPTYQLTDEATFESWDWKQTFPGRDELTEYFKHLDKEWGLSRDISYKSRVTSMIWDASSSRWQCEINQGESKCTAWNVVLCTGFASKRYIPPFKDLDKFKGELHHTAVWPQTGVNLKDKRVAVIGTGASGVQVIQEVGKEASHLTVYQRTPNTALPMENPDVTAAQNASMRSAFPQTKKSME